MSIYRKWGVEPIINVSGAVTRLGGAPMPAEVLAAFTEAAGECVPLDELQAAASRYIADVTGAEAGLVTAGAAAGLLLGTAAILTRYSAARMEQLPHSEQFPHEFVVAREHRNGYDHAVRAAGARFREVGFQEMIAGAGVRRVEAWEYEAAFGPQTAGVLYVAGHDACPPLEELVARAHAHALPVLVDAAGELPPRANLRRFIAAGADLVAFSGGKAIRGPQATGILSGRRDLIGPAALQMLDMDDHQQLWNPPEPWIDRTQLQGFPRHGIGRALKVSKEQIVALLTALERFVTGEDDAQRDRQQAFLLTIATGLEGLPVVSHLRLPDDGESSPTLELHVDEVALRRSAFEICRALRGGRPSIQVGHAHLAAGRLTVHPMHLDEPRTQAVLQRLREELGA